MKKLSPIPKRRAAAASPAEPSGQAAGKPPSLDFIAADLRPLAKPLADLAFLANNPLDHPEGQIEDLKAVLSVRGQLLPLLVNTAVKPAVVIGGNGRLQAMLSLGWTHAAVVEGEWDEATANSIAIELNRTQEGGTWNRERLTAMLRNVSTKCNPRLDAMLAGLAEKVVCIKSVASAGEEPALPDKYEIIVTCAGEEQQKEIYERLSAEGLSCRVLTL